MAHIQLIRSAFNALFQCHPDALFDEINQYFSKNYQQTTDGNRLDLEGFYEHISKVRRVTKSIHVQIISYACNGPYIFTHHQAYVEKINQLKASIDVLAHFEIQNSKIVRCYELTQVLEGSPDDKKLASDRD